jgi:SagB-type dehydrogenase family enzyme
MSTFRARRSRALITTFYGSAFQVTNFIKRRSFSCNSTCLRLLAEFSEWTVLTDYISNSTEFSANSIVEGLKKLLDMGALVIEGSQDAELDALYGERWQWGPTAGLYHFGIRDAKYLNDAQTEKHIRKRAEIRPAPVNYKLNDAATTSLGTVDTNDPVFAAMLRRRTVRGFKQRSITKLQLAECLLAGLGIVGFYDDPLLGRMPVKMSPSGGARNPYEAFVYALNVRGLPRGIYHYSALEKNLGTVSTGRLPKPGTMLSGQNWTNEASAIIFLVANFDRTMWKYQNPTAYRVVIIEAGHIAQNIAITAAKLGLSANPTSAIQDSLTERALGVAPPMEAVIYALSIGWPDPTKGPLRPKATD